MPLLHLKFGSKFTNESIIKLPKAKHKHPKNQLDFGLKKQRGKAEFAP